MFAPTAAGCSMYKLLVAHHSTISCQQDLADLNWAGRGQQWDSCAQYSDYWTGEISSVAREPLPLSLRDVSVMFCR